MLSASDSRIFRLRENMFHNHADKMVLVTLTDTFLATNKNVHVGI